MSRRTDIQPPAAEVAAQGDQPTGDQPPAAEVAAQGDQPTGDQPARTADGRFAPRDLTTDPQVQALIAAEVKRAAKQAADAARAEAAEAAKKAAERAQMDEVARLQAEKADAEKAAQDALAAAAQATADAEYSLALVMLGVQLAGPEASQLIRFAAQTRRAADPQLTWQDAVSAAIEQNPYLVAPQAPAQPAQPAGQGAPAPAVPLHTRPAVVTPAAPAAPKPTPAVDALRMTPAEYRAYKSAQYGS